jgi:uncharacterized oxidoreductase
MPARRRWHASAVPRHLPPEALHRIAAAIVRAAGSEPDEAETVAEHLVGADLRGHDGHGVSRLPAYLDAVERELLVPNTPARLVEDGGSWLRFAGDRGYGQRVGREATAVAIERARETGLCALTIGTVHHLGRLGAYGEQATDAGLVSIAFVNAIDVPPTVAPHGGIEARMATNPVCIAFPAGEEQPATLVDMATAAIAMGPVRVAARDGVPVAEGLLIDADGRPTRDPNVMMADPRGALLPFGGHKGYGLMLACELLAGILGGGGTVQPDRQRRGTFVNNLLAFVVDPARFADPAWLRAEVDAHVGYVRSSRPADAAGEVLQPGDPERLALARRTAEGIPLDADGWEQLVGAGRRVGVDVAGLTP